MRKEELEWFELYGGAGSAGLVTGVGAGKRDRHVPKVSGVGFGRMEVGMLGKKKGLG